MNIETERLRLDPITRADADELSGILDDERDHLHPWIVIGTRAEARASSERLADDFAAGGHRVWVARSGPSVVGGFGLRRRAGALELSYWLRARATGEGLASEACAALCAFAFGETDVLEVRCHARNAASARVARQLGFVLAEVGGADADEVHLWRAHAATWPAWRALKRACASVAPVIADDRGRLHVGDARLALVSVDGAPHVVAVSDVGPESAFAGRTSLAHNATLAVGALAICDGRLQLRYACPPDGATPLALRLFVDEAERLRRLALPPPFFIPVESTLSDYYTA